MTEGEGSSQRTYRHSPQTDNGGVMARGKGPGLGGGRERGVDRGICNTVNNKNKVKK